LFDGENGEGSLFCSGGRKVQSTKGTVICSV